MAGNHLLSKIALETEEGDSLKAINALSLPKDIQCAYLLTDGEVFDFKKMEDGNRQ